jgi:hypothetical protein
MQYMNKSTYTVNQRHSARLCSALQAAYKHTITMSEILYKLRHVFVETTHQLALASVIVTVSPSNVLTFRSKQ